MSYEIIPTSVFKNQSKRLIRKFPSLKSELQDLLAILTKKPESGTPLGNNTYKIRLAVKSKGKGKSGGVRIITYKVDKNKEVYLLNIYDKSEIASVEDKIITGIITQILKSR